MSIFKNIKLWIIVALVIAVVGAAMIGIFGLNQTPDYKAAYQVKVSVDQNIDSEGELIDNAAKAYFDEIGYNSSCYATEVSEDGTTYVYKFSKEGDVNEDALKEKLTAELADKTAEISLVEYKQTLVNGASLLKTFIACGLGLIATFIIALFIVKAAGALTIVCNSVITAVIFVMLVAITRIPALPDIAVVAAFAMILAATMTFAITVRYNELLKADVKADLTAIAEKGVEKENVRLWLIAGAGVIAAIALSVTCSVYLVFTGLKVLLATCSAFIVSCVATPVLWKLFKNKKSKA